MQTDKKEETPHNSHTEIKVQKHTKTGLYWEQLNDQLLPLTTRGR